MKASKANNTAGNAASIPVNENFVPLENALTPKFPCVELLVVASISPARATVNRGTHLRTVVTACTIPPALAETKFTAIKNTTNSTPTNRCTYIGTSATEWIAPNVAKILKNISDPKTPNTVPNNP